MSFVGSYFCLKLSFWVDLMVVVITGSLSRGWCGSSYGFLVPGSAELGS
ncbi:hypothetical protein A2U01_0111886 [Trifolium medium]|uniref:Uncharacterized protein n=1 Tax=Trifolium medium TaxID=97028 RepID=A0A392VSZ9_9FABA|nr:hypothetical protein [Trifolium medium]